MILHKIDVEKSPPGKQDGEIAGDVKQYLKEKKKKKKSPWNGQHKKKERVKSLSLFTRSDSCCIPTSLEVISRWKEAFSGSSRTMPHKYPKNCRTLGQMF